MGKNLYLLVRKAVILSFLALNLSCHREISPNMSFLIIAVDRLSSLDINCSHQSKKEARPSSGESPTLPSFETLCGESIQFSHAYTTSLQSQPALASILTGLYPTQHGVRNNLQYLSSSIDTLAERAFDLGFDTIFITGGAPILRKSGFSQGYVFFDDYIRPTPQTLFRPFKNSAHLLTSRLRDAHRSQFFSVVYVPDLNFTDQITKNKLGETRSQSFDSQLEEFDEGLGEIMEALRLQNKWENTNIIVVGLSGHPEDKKLPENPIVPHLESQEISVGLLWKPAKILKVSPQMIHHTINLADIGATLQSMLGLSNSLQESSGLQVNVIRELLDSNLNQTGSTNLPPVRKWLSIESNLHLENQSPQISSVLTNGDFLCKPGKPTKCYNLQYQGTEDEATSLFSVGSDLNALKLQVVAHQLASTNNLTFFESRPPEVPHQLSPSEAQLNCLQQIKNTRLDLIDSVKCDESTVQELLAWVAAEQNPSVDQIKRDLLKKKFLVSLFFRNIDRKVFSFQSSRAQIWDVPQDLMTKPDLIDLVFELPGWGRYKTMAYRALTQFREEPQ